MAKLYWRVKRGNKWTWKPLKGKWMTSESIARDLITYSKCENPEEEE